MKQTIILLALLSASLLGSYATWTSDSTEISDDGVAVFTADSPSALMFTSPNTDVSIERRSEDGTDFTWVTVTDRKRIKKPVPPTPPASDNDQADETSEDSESAGGEDNAQQQPDDEPEKPAVVEEVETTVTQFRGSDASEDLWEGFTPLMAIRTLTTTASDDALGFGSDKGGTITVKQAGAEVTLELGGETYGSKDRYLRHNGTLFLVDDKHIRSISSAKARLIERRVHPLDEKAIERVTIRYGDQEAILVQKNADDRAAAFWARDGETEADSAAGTWLGKLFRLKVQSYESLVETPLRRDFSVSVEGNGQTWTIDILKSDADSNPDYYAKSTFNQGLVKLTKSIASDASEDIMSIFNAVDVTP